MVRRVKDGYLILCRMLHLQTHSLLAMPVDNDFVRNLGCAFLFFECLLPSIRPGMTVMLHDRYNH